MSQARFEKRMREKARADKAREKQARKQDRAAEAEAAALVEQPASAPEPEVLDQLAALHHRFEADEIDFEEFEQLKHELLAQLDV
ncbi:MAG: hypothetical protein KDB37_13890 [Ilumatobacter sp.]|nr:hypothetical protein [Ilumatobacter sp.]